MKRCVSPFEQRSLDEIKISGLGAKSREKLAAAGLHLVGDLLAFLPRNYLDYAQVTPIGEAAVEAVVQVRGRVLQKKHSRTHVGMTILELLLDDGSGTIRALWFNQPWLKTAVEKGQFAALHGKVHFEKLGRTLKNPKFKLLETENEQFSGIEPIYRQVGGLNSEKVRGWITALIDQMPDEDCLDPALCRRLGLPSRRAAFARLHAPQDSQEVKTILSKEHPCYKRLVFEEFLCFQRVLAGRNRDRRKQEHRVVQPAPGWLARFLLPFQLTADQQRVLAELDQTLERGGRLHALIQGDVGCGKTVVGLAMAFLFSELGLQSALLCPTTILARQHWETARNLLEPLGVKVVLLSSQVEPARLKAGLDDLAQGRAQLVVGTHRLIQRDVLFADLGLVLIDEQHRFGVNQRATLLRKGRHPHYLAFSATPIPRSLALTVHGDFEVLQIREKPAGRIPVRTILKKAERREEVEAFARFRISKGEGVFWVFPLIGDGEEEQEAAYHSAQAAYTHFRSGHMPAVGLVHGRMPKEEVAQQMAAFAAGEIRLLVATTVIEVGVDIPHASIMVIEGADRFGLSQLHQLRGRVGRGGNAGFCFLIASEKLTRDGLERLKVLRDSNDGFFIAESDLQLRGAGELLGKQQSGDSGFVFGDPWLDRKLMDEARRLVQTISEEDNPC